MMLHVPPPHSTTFVRGGVSIHSKQFQSVMQCLLYNKLHENDAAHITWHSALESLNINIKILLFCLIKY